MSASELAIRPLAHADLPTAHKLSVAVGWPHRIEDWAFALAVGDGIVAELDGQFAGTAMWWPFGASVARLGLVIVDPELQRSGIGKRLMQEVLERLTGFTVLLVATTAGAPLYRKLGFRDSTPIKQHQGFVIQQDHLSTEHAGIVRPAAAGDLAQLIELDRQASGASRAEVIKMLVNDGTAIVMEGDGRIVGFAIRRRFGRGEVIGPVVARTENEAKALIHALLSDRVSSFLRVDMPVDGHLSEWLAARGLANVSQVVTMVLGPAPVTSAKVKRFALVSQALG